MPFEQARLLTSSIHYVITTLILISFVFYRYSGLVKAILRFYFLSALWASICFILNGCPLTFIENVISVHYYGCQFYPDYSFSDTDIKYLLSYKAFYYPLILALTIVAIRRINGDNDILR